MRRVERRRSMISLAAIFLLLLSLIAASGLAFGAIPVVDAKALAKWVSFLPVAKATRDTLMEYLKLYDRVNRGVHEGIDLVKQSEVRRHLDVIIGSNHAKWQRLERAINLPDALASDIKGATRVLYAVGGIPPKSPPDRAAQLDAAFNAGELGLLEAARAEKIIQAIDRDADAAEAKLKQASQSGAAKINAAISAAMYRAVARLEKLLAVLIRVESLEQLDRAREQLAEEQRRVAHLEGLSRMIASIPSR